MFIFLIHRAPNATPEIKLALNKIGVRYRHIPLSRTGLNPFMDLRTFSAMHRLFESEQPDKILAYTAKPVIYASFHYRTLLYSSAEHYLLKYNQPIT